MVYLKFILLLLSLSGYILYIRNKGIEIAFAPALTTAGIGITMFFAGILNIMPQAACLIFVGGLFLCFYVLKTTQKLDMHGIVILSFFLIFSAVLCLLYRNIELYHADDFSHWALVVKNMLLTDQLPKEGAILTYQNYPTGTAGFIYFVCKFLGMSESNMLRGQALLIVSEICSLWAFTKKRHLLSGMAVSIFSIYLLVSFGSARNLLVDLVLTLFGTTAFLLLLYYRKDMNKAYWGNCILSSYLVLVKNSSLFFVILHILPVLYFTYTSLNSCGKAFSRKAIFQAVAVNLLIPVAVYYLWDRHVAYAFPGGDMTRHSLSLSYLLDTFSQKSSEEIVAVFVKFVYHSLTVGFQIPSFLIVLAVFSFGIIQHYHHRLPERPVELVCLLWGLVAFGSYMLSLLGMYLFSMPYAEAIILGSYIRYVSAIAIYLLCICFVYLLNQISSAEKLLTPAAVIAPVIACCMLFTARSSIPSLYRNIPSKTEDRAVLTDIRHRYQIPGNSSYYIICGDWDVYVRFVARYDFWSGRVVEIRDPLNAPPSPEILHSFDHLIILRQGDDVDTFLEMLGLPLGEQYYYLPEYR